MSWNPNCSDKIRFGKENGHHERNWVFYNLHVQYMYILSKRLKDKELAYYSNDRQKWEPVFGWSVLLYFQVILFSRFKCFSFFVVTKSKRHFMLKPFAQTEIAIELIFLTREELNARNNRAGHTVFSWCYHGSRVLIFWAALYFVKFCLYSV